MMTIIKLIIKKTQYTSSTNTKIVKKRVKLTVFCFPETATEVIRHCVYETAERDDVVLRQGEDGDR